jgi:hemerythrin-like metal-binding protein
MPKILIWEPSMSVGVNEIDEQHKKLISIISDFYESFDKGEIQAGLEVALQKLIEYAVYHFETEEKYFDKFNYEFKDEHKQKHKNFKEKVLVFQERFKKEGTSIVLEFMDFLNDWLVDHLENEDQKYVKCFHDNGLF